MILYAAYVKGSLLDQVAAETEEAALAKLRLDYPKLEGEVVFEIVDGDYNPNPIKVAAATAVEPTTTATESKGARPFAVVEADKLDIHINVSSGSISDEDIKELEKAAEQGLIIAKKKGN